METNEYLQTLYPNIYACGDVAGPYQFTHTAVAPGVVRGGECAVRRAYKRFRADYSVIPWATFTDPEVARVGLERDRGASEKNIAVRGDDVYGIDELDRAIADERGARHGEGADRRREGPHPRRDHRRRARRRLIVEFIAAMKHGIGLNKILGTIHVYPTLAEANKYAAGDWKRAHAPQRLLAGARARGTHGCGG